jgi:hypothetical protein
MRVSRVFRKWDSLSPPPPPLYYEAPQQVGYIALSLSIESDEYEKHEKAREGILYNMEGSPPSSFKKGKFLDARYSVAGTCPEFLFPLPLSVCLSLYTCTLMIANNLVVR